MIRKKHLFLIKFLFTFLFAISLVVLTKTFSPGILNTAVAQETPMPTAVPTFHSLGIYWSPADGAEDNSCQVRYRKIGSPTWNQGFDLWFDSINYNEYRGSLVHLIPDTTYEIELTLTKTGTKQTFTASTWSEDFPIGQTIELPELSHQTLVINQSGTPDGYILYTHAPGSSATIDGQNSINQAIEVRASYIIIRGLTIKNPREHGINLFQNVHDVVIEENDISGWGEIASDGWGKNHDAAVYSNITDDIERIIVQRNKFHHPRSDSNSWSECRPAAQGCHPSGPQVIDFHRTKGNHVFRYNEVYSDADHYFNDIFGGMGNDSLTGFPSRDSDIYGNVIANCWDDGIESEGGNQNVRIWANYITNTFMGIATRSTTIGPIYIWRNLGGHVSGNFHKSGTGGGGDLGVFVFHNTVLQPGGANRGVCGVMLDTTTRNNILDADDYSIKVENVKDENDFDYDLYNELSSRVDLAQEAHGIKGDPIYSSDFSFDLINGKGIFTLDSSSPGYDAGVRIPNFNDNFTGAGPDMGAHEAGTPPMEFGVNAYRTTPPTCGDGSIGSGEECDPPGDATQCSYGECQSDCTCPLYQHCLPLGDIDCSGKINGLDFAYLVSKWGTSDPKANLDDGDGLGIVNATDALILLGNYGEEGS